MREIKVQECVLITKILISKEVFSSVLKKSNCITKEVKKNILGITYLFKKVYDH